MGNLIYRAVLENPTTRQHVFSSSGGNAGLAAVTAANTYNLPSTVVIPYATSDAVEKKLKGLGAEVIRHGDSWLEADALCRTLCSEADGLYCPPFDHEHIWEGNGTIADEVREDLGRDPDLVITTVGGGGLLIGLAEGFPTENTKFLAVETAGADSLSKSLKAKKVVTLPTITSSAVCLGTKTPAKMAFKLASNPRVTSFVVEDREAEAGCVRIADEERVMVENACGAGVAALYKGAARDVFKGDLEGKAIVIIVCGGSDISIEKLHNWRKEHGEGPNKVSWL